ncbi:hypothetical protein EC968_002912 [Mortierella alpina]|nr:hypothetical protein EC968_002912 [Mortierella alpina]
MFMFDTNMTDRTWRQESQRNGGMKFGSTPQTESYTPFMTVHWQADSTFKKPITSASVRESYGSATGMKTKILEANTLDDLSETGSVFSIVYDIPNKRLTGLLGLSKGHATQPELARGDKRNPEDLARWWKLSEIGKQTERTMISEQVDVVESFIGSGNLDDIDLNACTL